MLEIRRLTLTLRSHVLLPSFALLLSGILSWGKPPVSWDLRALNRPPAVYSAPGFEQTGVRSLFFEGPSYHGHPTRVFAWYGAPAHAPGERVPAMVLVHGGGGTAFAEWVRLWNGRGYAAIALDTCGAVPGPGAPYHEKPQRHQDGGPPGWDDSFDQVDEPVTDQWTYQAIADIILAHSLLRSFHEIDPRLIGVTGISWGGYLTAIVAGVDPRFHFAVPVYGCGFLGDDSAWVPAFQKMGVARASRWLGLWDPSVYLPRVRMPMLWVSGSNDFAYPLPLLQKSYRLPRRHRPQLAIRLRMPHGHKEGATPEEIRVFADALIRGRPNLVQLIAQGTTGPKAWAQFDRGSSVSRAELNYTRDTGKWQDRRWETSAAAIEPERRRVEVAIPSGARIYFLNLFDSAGRVTSSQHVTIESPSRLATHAPR